MKLNGLQARVLCLACMLALVSFVVYSSSLTVSADDSGIMPIANPTDTTETLTKEEMAALFAGSKCTYSFQVWNDDKTFLEPVQTGTVIPVVCFISSSAWVSSSANIFIFLPISGLFDKLVYSFSCSFELPFVVNSCDYIVTGMCPSSYCFTSSSKYTYHLSPNMEYNLYNTSNELITSQRYYAPDDFSSSNTVRLENGYYAFGSHASNKFYRATGSVSSPAWNTADIRLFGLFQDVGSFGFSWVAGPRATQTGTDTYTEGLGFLVQNFTIHYNVGGGYDPNGGSGGSGGGDIEPDPDNPGGGGSGSGVDYSAQLDKLYDELLKQGLIQQQQNAAILQGQQDILDAQKEQAEQDMQLWQDTFDPLEDDVSSLGDDIFSEDTQKEVTDKLGLFTFLDDTMVQFLDVFEVDSGQSTALRFPGLNVTVNGTDYEVIKPYDFDIKETLDKFEVLISAIRFINGIIIIFAFLSYLHRLKVRFFGDD